MFEAEAKSKKCCSPSQFIIDQGGNCITDQCVAWDWNWWTQETSKVVQEGGFFVDTKIEMVPAPRENWQGDCRLLRKR